MTKKTAFKTIEIEGKQRQVETKNYQVAKFVFPEVKADAPVAEQGIFEAYVSVFGNVDSYGDIVDKGAFDQWLKDWFPRYPKVVLNHDWTQPIAKIISIVEDELGLKVTAQLLLELPKAKETFILMREGVLTDFSFGFSIEEDFIDPATNFRHLKTLAIWECSPVLVGANRKATLTGLKSVDPAAEGEEAPAPATEEPEVKKGAVLSKKNKALVQNAITALSDLLAAASEEAAAPQPEIKKAIKILVRNV